MADSLSPIFVTGATGRHGGTGGFVARDLVRRGVPVRALVRSDDGRARTLAADGVSVVTGDLNDRRSLVPALEGVKIAYFTYPVAGGIVTAAAHFAAAAREAGVERVVVMSMAAAQPESPSPLGRAQWLAEEVLEWAGFDTLNLRVAAIFAENLDLLHGHEIHGEGAIRNTFRDVPLSWMTGEDAGRLAVAALLHPERAGGARTLYPSGGTVVSHAQIAAALSEKLGRPIRHETIARADWIERLLARREADERVNADMAAHISAVGLGIRETMAQNNLFETFTGQQPVSVLDAVRAGRVGAPPIA